MGALDELNAGLEDLRRADLANYAKRLRDLEVKMQDLEHRLGPLLAILKPKGG